MNQEKETARAERLRRSEEAEAEKLRRRAKELRGRNEAGEPGTVAVSLEETLGLVRAVDEFVYADGGRRMFERMDLVGGLEDWARHVLEERQEFFDELLAERGPGEEPPTAEEVRAAMEDYRRRIAADAAEREREAAKREREVEWFIVKPDNGTSS